MRTCLSKIFSRRSLTEGEDTFNALPSLVDGSRALDTGVKVDVDVSCLPFIVDGGEGDGEQEENKVSEFSRRVSVGTRRRRAAILLKERRE